MSVQQPIVAIDARLVGGTSTGDSTYWTGLLGGLAEVGASQILLFSDRPRPTEAPAEFEWVHLPAKHPRWWSLVQFPLAARKAGANVIHGQYSLSPLIGARGITTIHDVSFFIGPEWFRTKDRLILQKSVPATAKRSGRVITVSNSSAGEIERFIPAAKGKVVVTHLACPPWIQRVGDAEAKQVADSLGIRGPYMLTVSTRWPRKNMGLAVAAVELLPESVPHRLVLTGKYGWGEHELGGRGISTGYVSNEQLSALYSGASLYLSPSRHEGFGIPVLEAFRTGCPVLCSAGGALPEVAGDAGAVESSWEPADWARAIESLLGDPSKLAELRRRGFEREKQFTWAACARRTLEVYREVALP